MYPPGFATRILPEGPATSGLEDRFRPHFFGGVATVVGKLFTQCRPDIAVFGQKDYQQLKVVTRMAADLNLGVKIIGAPIVRERDGLAMSSRNVYLSPEQRAVAPVLHRTMKDAAKRLRNGDDLETVMADGRKRSRTRVSRWIILKPATPKRWLQSARSRTSRSGSCWRQKSERPA